MSSSSGVELVESERNKLVPKYYEQICGTFTIQHLKNSLSYRCDELVKFQSKIMEQLDIIIQKLTHK